MALYAIRNGCFVKLGSTKNEPRSRLTAIARRNHVPDPASALVLIAEWEGELEDELELHRQFAYLNHYGDWFRLNQELSVYLMARVLPENERQTAQPVLTEPAQEGQRENVLRLHREGRMGAQFGKLGGRPPDSEAVKRDKRIARRLEKLSEDDLRSCARAAQRIERTPNWVRLESWQAQGIAAGC